MVSMLSLLVKNNLQVKNTYCKHVSFLFSCAQVCEIFPLLFWSIYWSAALQLFIICGSEPGAKKKKKKNHLTNAATVQF